MKQFLNEGPGLWMMTAAWAVLAACLGAGPFVLAPNWPQSDTGVEVPLFLTVGACFLLLTVLYLVYAIAGIPDQPAEPGPLGKPAILRMMKSLTALGVAVALAGCVLKFMHLPFASEMLIIGLGTYGVVLFYTSFLPQPSTASSSASAKIAPYLAGIGGSVLAIAMLFSILHFPSWREMLLLGVPLALLGVVLQFNQAENAKAWLMHHGWLQLPLVLAVAVGAIVLAMKSGF